MAAKIYTSRDSATAVLRKAGIPSRDYSLYITKTVDGKFSLDMDRLAAAKSGAVTHTKEPAKAAVEKQDPSAGRKATVSSVARSLILSGWTNDAVWSVLKRDFGLDDGKRHYPSWYRCQLARQGRL